MNEETIRTNDKRAALALLERCLASPDLLNVRMQNLDGEFSVEVSRPTKGPAPDDPPPA